MFGKKCCDPWSIHTKTITTTLTEIKVDLSEKFTSVCKINVIPGKKTLQKLMLYQGKNSAKIVWLDLEKKLVI